LKGVIRKYDSYSDYVEFQKTKTNDPVRRKKWLNEEWDLKLSGFIKEFSKIKEAGYIKNGMQALCLGARTGQEVVALQSLGLVAIGIDLVPQEPYVVEGDIHDLKYNDDSFDFVYTNIIDHTIHPDVMMKEAERVLKPGGYLMIQMQAGIHQDEYTEFNPESPRQICDFLKNCTCIISNYIYNDKSINAHGMNFELFFQKNI
jgi:SAM-dependent methyltransferase